GPGDGERAGERVARRRGVHRLHRYGGDGQPFPGARSVQGAFGAERDDGLAHPAEQEVEGGGGSGGAGDAGGFVLVGQQQGGGVEQVVREGLGGGGGEDDGDAGVAGGAGGGGDGFHRQLQLEQERLGGGDDGAFGFGGAGDGAVRAGDDDDRVAALVVDHDVGDAARPGDPAEE